MTPMSHNSPLASQASTVAMTPLSSSIPHLCRGNLEASSLQNLQVPSFLPLLPLPKDQHDDKPGEVNLQRTQDHTAHSHMAHEAHETHPPQNPQTPSFLPLLPLLRDQRNDEPRGINLQRTQEDTTHSHTPPETQRTHTPQRLARDSSPALPKRLPVNLIIARGTLLHLIPGVSLPGHQRPVIEIRWWASRLCKKKYGLSAKDDGQPHGYFKTIDRVKVSLNAPTDQPLDQLLRNRLSYTHKVIPFRCTTYVSGVKPQHWVKYAKLENARVAWDKLAVDFSGYHNVAVLRRDIHSILLQSCRGRVLKSGGALNALSDAEWTHDMTELGKPWLSLPLAGEAYNARVIGTQQMIWWSAQSSPQVPFTDEELQSVRQGRNGPNGEEQSPSTSLGSDALIEYLRLPKSRSASF
ncbi:hypothetical protein HD806DRAFT_524368 [Xylariaceae sp. AK1471]|nr:hypothetical protein HD806DRAFT_524368 [Xylariaceae sp. AK1471]